MNCLIDPCVLLAADSRCLLDLNEDAGRVLLDLLVTSYFTCALSSHIGYGFRRRVFNYRDHGDSTEQLCMAFV
jgi:hypothetical protein